LEGNKRIRLEPSVLFTPRSPADGPVARLWYADHVGTQPSDELKENATSIVEAWKQGLIVKKAYVPYLPCTVHDKNQRITWKTEIERVIRYFYMLVKGDPQRQKLPLTMKAWFTRKLPNYSRLHETFHIPMKINPDHMDKSCWKFRHCLLVYYYGLLIEDIKASI
jgi:hypothetical protein